MTIGLNSNLLLSNSSAANFTAWGSAISGALSTIGWTQTTDTGQVAWGGTPSPPSSTYVYEIWKMADTAQSTSPVFLKMEYGFSSTNWGIRMSLGQGSNGSGTLTGTISNIGGSGVTSLGNSAGVLPCYIAGTSGSLYMALGNTSFATNTYSTAAAIERFLNSSGVATTAGVTFLFSMPTANSNGFHWNYSYTYASAFVITGGHFALTPNNSNSGSNFMVGPNTVPAFPVFPVAGQILNPMIGVVCVSQADVTANTQITVTSMYGSSHNYILAGGSVFGQANARSNASQALAFGLRFE